MDEDVKNIINFYKEYLDITVWGDDVKFIDIINLKYGHNIDNSHNKKFNEYNMYNIFEKIFLKNVLYICKYEFTIKSNTGGCERTSYANSLYNLFYKDDKNNLINYENISYFDIGWFLKTIYDEFCLSKEISNKDFYQNFLFNYHDIYMWLAQMIDDDIYENSVQIIYDNESVKVDNKNFILDSNVNIFNFNNRPIFSDNFKNKILVRGSII